jgi:hypothetical protein
MELETSLASAQVAFCDSKQALEKAYSFGLPRSALIKTISPSLILSGMTNIESLEERLPQTVYSNFFYSGKNFAKRVYQAAILNDELKQYALLIARVASGNDSFFLKAGLLDDEDYVQPRAVIEFDTGNESMNARMGSVWSEILQPNKRLVTKKFDISVFEERDLSGGISPGLFKRMQFASFQSFQYRTLERLCHLLPKTFFKQRIDILSEGEMVKEAAAVLCLKGYKLNKIKLGSSQSSEHFLSDRKRHAIISVIKPLIEARVKTISASLALDPVVERCIRQICTAIKRFDSTFAHSTKEFKEEKPAALLTGYPGSPEVLALAAVAQKNKVPFFSFQHGLDREITQMQDHSHVTFENSVTNFFVTYNSFAARLSQNNFYAKNLNISDQKIFPGGWSTEHYSVSKNRRRIWSNDPSILFVSTSLYRGYFARRSDANLDVGMAREEVSLLKEVFNQIPHKVAFKPYPAMRFPDPDVVLEYARGARNLELVGTHVDLRYLISNFRILIVSRATSTVGWCLMSKKPLIYIDMPGWFSLREEMHSHFKDSVFYFDSRKLGYMKDLRTFLSKPIKEIEKEWAKKSPARITLMNELIDDMGPGGGRRVAHFVETEIKANFN